MSLGFTGTTQKQFDLSQEKTLCGTRQTCWTWFHKKLSRNVSSNGRTAGRSVFITKETTLKGIRVSDIQINNCIFADQRSDTFWTALVCKIQGQYGFQMIWLPLVSNGISQTEDHTIMVCSWQADAIWWWLSMLCHPLLSHRYMRAQVRDLCHKKQMYARLHISVLGYVYVSAGAHIKLVGLVGEHTFFVTTKMLIVQYRKTWIWKNTRKGLYETGKLMYGWIYVGLFSWVLKYCFCCNLCQVRTSEWIASSVQGPHFVVFIALPSCCDHTANSILCESSPQTMEQCHS